MFYDEAKVKLRAGNGGHGCVSFRREKFIPKGGPDGGDGGNGGSVILECDENVGDLRQFHFNPHWEAQNGVSGRGRRKHGRNGKDRILKVPPGLVVRDLRTGREVAELIDPGETVVLLKGGSGGWGNTRFKSSVNRAPRQFKEGEPGQHGEFVFVLKTLADVGLVGFPNAGKSTLTRLLTAARPKTGAYPFTTLNPNVGMIIYEEGVRFLRLADIPGLIEGAHVNKGLGHRFLRHIERCRALVLLLDMAGTDGRRPEEDFAHLREELAQYSPMLVEKPYLIAANKMDEPAARKNLARFTKAHPGENILPVSCLLGEGTDVLKDRLWDLAQASPVSARLLRGEEPAEAPGGSVEYEENGRSISLREEDPLG